ncbi:MAG TPA: hypothetical protein VN688_10470 [Gemmataceae bacterium]|nr:hypothetical protein [Gemmataceae bacterium]
MPRMRRPSVVCGERAVDVFCSPGQIMVSHDIVVSSMFAVNVRPSYQTNGFHQYNRMAGDSMAQI